MDITKLKRLCSMEKCNKFLKNQLIRFAVKKSVKIALIIIAVIGIGLCIYFLGNSKKPKLPNINIQTKHFIRPDFETPCTIEYISEYEKDTVDAMIKIRGNYSLKYPKKSYTLDLDHSIDLCGLPHDKDFVLHANYIDKSFMRHKVSYDLFRQMNSNNIAAQCSYATVSINGNAIGLYTIMQKIDRTVLHLEKDDTMAMSFKDPTMFYKEYFEIYDSNRYEQKYPNFEVSNKTYVIEAFRNLLFNADDSTFAKNISQWIDINNVIDWFLVTYFTNNNDGVMKNFYFYKINSETPFRFAVWDYDYSYGRDHENYLKMNLEPILWEQSILFSRLMNNPDYRLQIKNRWFELRKNILTIENVKQLIDANHQQIKDAISDNSKIWPIDNKFYQDNNNYNDEIQLIYDYLNLYLPSYDHFFKGL